MESFIQTISFETEQRYQRNKECRYEFRKFGADKRLAAGVFDTDDSRDKITRYNLQSFSVETLERLLQVLSERHNAQFEWIKLCNATVCKYKPISLPEDNYSQIIKQHLSDRKAGKEPHQEKLAKSKAIGLSAVKTNEKFDMQKKEFALIYLVVKAVIDSHASMDSVLRFLEESDLPGNKKPSKSSLKALTTNNPYPEWKIAEASIEEQERYNKIAEFFLAEYETLTR